MSEYIYGVDTSKKITPELARDAMIRCFNQAHTEVLDLMDEFTEWESDKDREDFRNLSISLNIRNAFKSSGVDFDHPEKEGLIKALNELAELAEKFRKPDIVSKHYNQIKALIEKID